MPGLFYEPIDRKTFLGAATRVATAGVLTQIADSSLAADASATEAHIALLSDTHIPADSNNEYRGFRPVDNLRQIVPQVSIAR
jgi:hypothetical protein